MYTVEVFSRSFNGEFWTKQFKSLKSAKRYAVQLRRNNDARVCRPLSQIQRHMLNYRSSGLYAIVGGDSPYQAYICIIRNA